MNPNPYFVGHYDFRLVAVSILLSLLAAYAALDLAERVNTAREWTRVAWLYGGAAALGLGIWAMHYVGMLAFHLPIPILYDWPTVLVSLGAAMFASGVALYVVSRPQMSPGGALAGSVVMGGGIAAMHYIGMDAMRLRAMCVYSYTLVALSVGLAIVISFLALKLTFAGRRNVAALGRRKLVSSLILGAAIPCMHYTGMAAVSFAPTARFNGSLAHAFPISSFGLWLIVVVTIVILSQVFILGMANRSYTSKSQQLVENEIQLKTIFESLREGVLVLNVKTDLVQINAAASRILGLPPGPLCQKVLREVLVQRTLDGDLVAADDLPTLRALRGDYCQDCELEIYSNFTARSTTVEVSTEPIVGSSGEPNEVIVSLRDVSDRRRIEEARARLAAIVDSSQDAIIGMDLNAAVTSWNSGAEKIFGYTAAEMIGQPIQSLFPAGREAEEAEILDRIRHGHSVDQQETERQRKDGQIIQVSLTISPIRDGTGRVVGASKIARDMTERRMLERQLRQSQKMEAIGQLTGGIAHDFNNLLAIVIGNLGLLERMIGDNTSAMQRLGPAQRAASRGADLTRRLLALASQVDLNPIHLKIEDAVREMIELAARALGPEISIVTHFGAGLPAVFVDAAGLESALLNLAVNARDAMPDGGTLTFDALLSELDGSFPSVKTGELEPGTYARISVSDTGRGMSKETLERATEPFFTTKPRHKGTGLGLAMVYGFAKQSGGTIRLYSELNYGTTVSLYLPLAVGAAGPNAAAEPANFDYHRSGTALIVDDEPDLLEIAHVYLSDMGFSTLRASDAATALKMLETCKDIELMVTDIIMPGGMNGVQLAERARTFNPQLKVIYTSGFPADALLERNGTLTDGPMLRKPYHRADFVAVIRRTLDGPVLKAAAEPDDDARPKIRVEG